MQGADSTRRSLRVLVVEDEDALRAAVVRYLVRVGHRVLQARNGVDALTQLDREAVDVVFTDIRMPDMDGLALLRAVRQRDLDLPVVLATGAPSVATAAEAIEHGALAYLVKPVDLATLEATLRRAGALYGIARAKREGFALLGNEEGGPGDRAGLEASFDKTLETIWIAMQPLVSVKSRTLFGHEALMRSTERSLPHPGAVLDAAERLGRLTDLGRILRARTVEAFAAAALDTCLFVNLHPEDLLDETLFEIGSALALLAPRVVLEITERASLDHVRDVRARIGRLRELGFRIAIDDLGAGYAGLTAFADLEPDIVKLDMSLVRDVDTFPKKQKVVRTMTSLAHDLGMTVVVEGVETRGERDCVIELGADYLQGYLLAKPARPFPEWTWGD